MRSLDSCKKSFPNGVINEWNETPANAFSGDYDKMHLQKFKEAVNRMLRNVATAA